MNKVILIPCSYNAKADRRSLFFNTYVTLRNMSPRVPSGTAALQRRNAKGQTISFDRISLLDYFFRQECI